MADRVLVMFPSGKAPEQVVADYQPRVEQPFENTVVHFTPTAEECEAALALSGDQTTSLGGWSVWRCLCGGAGAGGFKHGCGWSPWDRCPYCGRHPCVCVRKR